MAINIKQQNSGKQWHLSISGEHWSIPDKKQFELVTAELQKNRIPYSVKYCGDAYAALSLDTAITAEYKHFHTCLLLVLKYKNMFVVGEYK